MCDDVGTYVKFSGGEKKIKQKQADLIFNFTESVVKKTNGLIL